MKPWMSSFIIAMALFLPSSSMELTGPKDLYLQYRAQYPRMTEHMYDAVCRAEERYKVHRSVILAFIWAESRFNPRATSPSKARGLMQIMPFWHAGKDKNALYNVEYNIMLGTRILSTYSRMAHGNIVAAAKNYNSGPGSPYYNWPYIRKIMDCIDISDTGRTYHDLLLTGRDYSLDWPDLDSQGNLELASQ